MVLARDGGRAREAPIPRHRLHRDRPRHREDRHGQRPRHRALGKPVERVRRKHNLQRKRLGKEELQGSQEETEADRRQGSRFRRHENHVITKRSSRLPKAPDAVSLWINYNLQTYLPRSRRFHCNWH